MVSVLNTSVVDCGFDYTIGICHFSAKHAALRSKTSWLGIRIMCQSKVTLV
jgi:hypothetical protein